MKMLIYVPAKLALLNNATVSGNVDYAVSRELAAEVVDHRVADLLARFAIDDSAEPAPGVHRLVVANAADDAVLDALLGLKSQLDAARRWAESDSTRVPSYVRQIWNRYPHSLYRGLLGGAVTEKICEIEGAPSPEAP